MYVFWIHIMVRTHINMISLHEPLTTQARCSELKVVNKSPTGVSWPVDPVLQVDHL